MCICEHIHTRGGPTLIRRGVFKTYPRGALRACPQVLVYSVKEGFLGPPPQDIWGRSLGPKIYVKC
jgi:hypothetical protein